MLATMSDAVREYAYAVGHLRPYSQYILSDYDTWELNPHYVGPDSGHPEYGEPTCTVYGTFAEASTAAREYAAGLGHPIRVEHYKGRCWVVWF